MLIENFLLLISWVTEHIRLAVHVHWKLFVINFLGDILILLVILLEPFPTCSMGQLN